MAAPPPSPENGSLKRDEPLIFVSDASAEAERLNAALRARGYEVVDVPLGLLVGRVAVQRPSLILCDVDAPGALETMNRLRDVPGGTRVDIIFLGEAGRTLDEMADAVFHEGSGTFVRPVDTHGLLRKVEALIGPAPTRLATSSLMPPSHRMPVRISSSQPPRSGRSDPPSSGSDRPPSSSSSGQRSPSSPPARRTSSSPPDQRAPSSPPEQRAPSSAPPEQRSPSSSAPQRSPSSPERSSSGPPPRPRSQPPPSRRQSAPPGLGVLPSLPPAVPLGFGAEREAGRATFARQIPQSEMSQELEMLLARAEQRVSRSSKSSGPLSTRLAPDDEVEAVLPADVLAMLDEPIDVEDADEDDGPGSTGTRSGSEAGRTGTGSATAATTGISSASVAGAALGQALRTNVGATQSTGVTGPGVPPPSEGAAVNSSALGAVAMLQPTAPPPPRMAAPDDGAPPATADSEPPPTPPAVPTRPPTSSWVPEPEEPPSEVQREPPPPIRLDELLIEPELAPPPREVSTTPPRAPPGPEAQRQIATQPPQRPRSVDPPNLEIPPTLGRGDALRGLARAIRSRYTGALAFEGDTGIRRVVFRDGDFVTAASGIESESLVGFLTQRGDLSADAARLARKLPQFGRHAGAALIAHGHLRQDDLWPVLRAHAEWILGRIVAMTRGAASVERQVPPRLQAEPAVFGGATGAEVLVEISRRTLPPGEALQRLGGPGAELLPGPSSALLRECALAEPEMALVEETRGQRLVDVIARAGAPEFASVLYALSELGVLESAPMPRAIEPAAEQPDELDEEALRSRILARLALVQEGDYFALLGVARGATSYDIRRAYLELRREFEPNRALTVRTVDLRDEVDTILEVLDEAYEILRDDRRRDRYRRALDASPR